MTQSSSTQGFFFDLDGTLTDSRAGIAQCFRVALETLDVTDATEQSLQQHIGAPLPAMFAAFLPDIAEADIARGIAAYRATYEREGIFVNTLYPGVRDMLTGLRQSGRPAWIVTTKPAHFAEQVVDILAIRDVLAGVVGPGLNEAGSKTVLVAQALEAAGLAPAQTVMLGDRHYDTIGAIENGVAPVGALWGYGGRDELSAAGCRDFATSAADFSARFVT